MSAIHQKIQTQIINRETTLADLNHILSFPQDDQETYYLFNITESLNFETLKSFYEKRFGSTSFIRKGQVIAYANFYRYQTDHISTIYLGNVIIKPEQRGQGYSKQLIQVMEHKAKTQFKTKNLCLAVFCNNTTAYALYIKMGFEVIRIEERKGWDNKEESIFIMSKQLN